MRPLWLPTLLGLAVVVPDARADFTLDDGDHVVFLGNTLIEREQRYGWWELALTCRFPGKKVVFRNLGWSGDTVWGEARAGFGSTADGFKHLEEHTRALKPTVLVVGYGSNESFAGPGGVAAFTRGLETLLDTLAGTKAKVVLLSPLCQGTMGPPLPDPRDQNRNLRLYADAIAAVAKKRGHRFIDLYDRLGDLGKVKGVSDNGIHLTGRGYRWSAPELMAGLGAAVPPATLTLDAAARKGSGSGAKVEWLESASPRFRVRDGLLPQGPRQVILGGLRAGNHSLLSEGKVLATASAAEWAKGIRVERGPEFDRREKLRRTIVAKNVLYFHRWRPENVTYLFGFRKNEQGRNAREIPQFDPLVEAKEKEIVALSGPVAHVYEIRPSGR